MWKRELPRKTGINHKLKANKYTCIFRGPFLHMTYFPQGKWIRWVHVLYKRMTRKQFTESLGRQKERCWTSFKPDIDSRLWLFITFTRFWEDTTERWCHLQGVLLIAYFKWDYRGRYEKYQSLLDEVMYMVILQLDHHKHRNSYDAGGPDLYACQWTIKHISLLVNLSNLVWLIIFA